MKIQKTLGITIRLVGFMAGLMIASLGAYLFLSGVIVLGHQLFLPGMLDILIGFLLVRAGRHIIPLHILSHDA